MKKALWLVSFIPLIITAVVLQFLPESIPMHYDLAGNIDRWGSRMESFIFPVIILLMTLFWYLLMGHYEKKSANAKNDKERVEAAANARMLGIVAIVSAVLWTTLQCAFLYGSYTAAKSGAASATVNYGKFSSISIGVLLIIVANFMTRTRINSTVGVRTVWSMYNDNTWRKSNRFGAIALMIAGALTVVASACMSSAIGATIVSLVLVCLAAAVVVAYSYHVYKAERQEEIRNGSVNVNKD